jgi:hypothetical protein
MVSYVLSLLKDFKKQEIIYFDFLLFLSDRYIVAVWLMSHRKGDDEEIEFYEIEIGIFQLFAKSIRRSKRS